MRRHVCSVSESATLDFCFTGSVTLCESLASFKGPVQRHVFQLPTTRIMVRVLGYISGGPCSIPGTTKKKVVGLERCQLRLVSATKELLDRKVSAPV
jgi:hypothetical protein